jgi:hypothetical protein
MSTYRYPMINIQQVTSRAKGKSDTAALKSLFPETPGNTIDANSFRIEKLKELLKGEIVDNLQVGTSDRDFGASATDASRVPPDLKTVAVGAGGLPASPWVPNPTSPGEGSTNPADLKEAPAGYGMNPTNSIANDGASTDATTPSRNPYESSKRMSHGAEEAQYVPGKSPATSNAS